MKNRFTFHRNGKSSESRMFFIFIYLLTISGVSFCEDSKEKDEKEALEIGGLVQFDYGSDIKDFKHQSLQIGRVELRAIVNVNPNVKGFITLLSQNDLSAIRIYQAAADLTLDKMPLEIVAGQQIFNHGLMTTRMISNPLGFDLLLPNQPGVTAFYTINSFKIGLAGLMTENITGTYSGTMTTVSGDTIPVTAERTDTARSFSGIISFDYTFQNGSNAHVSSLISQTCSDIDAACGIIIGKLTLDCEAYSKFQVSAGSQKVSTYCLGAAYSLSDAISVAFRSDGLSRNEQFKDMTLLFGAGVVAKVFGDCYIAAEYDYTKQWQGNRSEIIAVEFGLRSSLKLPGFQRKTLTNG
jgi:hypothetical protein